MFDDVPIDELPTDSPLIHEFRSPLDTHIFFTDRRPTGRGSDNTSFNRSGKGITEQ